jgi:repressor LexA
MTLKSAKTTNQQNSLPQPLTPKEKMVLEFIESFLGKQGVAPSYQEIKDHFGLASFNSVQRYLQQLVRKGYVYVPGGNQKRAMVLLHPSSALQNSVGQMQRQQQSLKEATSRFVPEKEASLLNPSPAESLSLRLLGRVAAGQPLEAFEHDEFIDVPSSLVRNPNKTFALRVQGDSMIEDGIFNHDIILVQSQSSVQNGQIAVATVENEATVKRIYQKGNQVELRPANSKMESMWYPAQQVSIRGVVVGLIRKF